MTHNYESSLWWKKLKNILWYFQHSHDRLTVAEMTSGWPKRSFEVIPPQDYLNLRISDLHKSIQNQNLKKIFHFWAYFGYSVLKWASFELSFALLLALSVLYQLLSGFFWALICQGRAVFVCIEDLLSK